MSGQGSEALLSPSDVADLAGVGRPVVSNWRRRHSDFPPAVAGSEAKPLFARDAVVAWLRRRGHKAEDGGAGGRVWFALNALRDRVRMEDAADLVMLLATLKCVNPVIFERVALALPADQGEAIREAVAELRQAPGLRDLREPAADLLELQPGLSLVVEAIAGAGVRDLAAAIDAVLERLSRSQIKGGAESGFVGSRTSALLASLARAGDGIVYDPACGIANVLIRIAEGRTQRQLVGSDINRDALRVGAQRAVLHGVSIDFVAADVLTSDPLPDLKADVVVVEPPFGMAWDSSSAMSDPRFVFGVPPRAASDLAWVQHAIAHLAPNGRAYVLTYPGALFRTGAERQIRANLLSAGCVDAVVALPPKMLPHTSIGPALWVLRPRSEPRKILLIDAADVHVDQVADKAAAWLGRAGAVPVEPDVPYAVVPVVELLAADAAIAPAKWVGERSIDGSSIADSFTRGSSAVARTLGLIADSSLALDELAEIPESRVATVRELVENGVVELQLGRPDKARNLAPAAQARIVRAADVKNRRLPATGGLPASADLDLTARGDVLVTTMNEVRAVVDEEGGHLASTGVDRLRILDTQSITADYLAAVLTGSWNSRLQAGTTIQRAPIRDLEVPLIPAIDQHKVAQALGSVGALRELSRNLERQTRETEHSILDALRYNVRLKPIRPAPEVSPQPDAGLGKAVRSQLKETR